MGWDHSELSDYRHRLSIALKAANICVFEVDVDRQLYTYFENSEAIFGVPGDKILADVRPFSLLPPEEYLQKAAEYFVHEDDGEEVAKAFEAVLEGRTAVYEVRMRAANSEYVWCRVCVTPYKNSHGQKMMVGVISNVQNMHKKIDTLIYESKLEPFTRLYTKRSFEAICTGLLESDEYSHENFALVMIDLDNFKKINDTYGHMAGDEVIIGVAEHLKSFFRGEDLICRYGGDEFAVLMRGIGSAEQVKRRIDQFLSEPDNRYHVTKSAGIAVTGTEAGSPQEREPGSGRFHELLRQADEAMYRAKKVKNKSCLA